MVDNNTREYLRMAVKRGDVETVQHDTPNRPTPTSILKKKHVDMFF